MNVTFACPRCDLTSRQDVATDSVAIDCTHCGCKIATPRDAFDAHAIRRCLVCPSFDLFVRKDFPQRLGVLLVAIGIVGSSITWAYSLVYATFAVLFVTALIDLALYLIVPNALMCYRCGAQYRLAEGMHRHAAFDLETHERHRQELIRLQERRAVPAPGQLDTLGRDGASGSHVAPLNATVGEELGSR